MRQALSNIVVIHISDVLWNNSHECYVYIDKI